MISITSLVNSFFTNFISVGAVGRTMEWRGGQKAENAPGRTHGKNRTSVGNSWSQPPLHSNSKRQRVGSAGPKQARGVKA